MKRISYATAGVVLGAGLAYWLDPQRGKRRRHELAQRAEHGVKEAVDAAQTVARDASQRGRGLVHRVSNRFIDFPVPDHVLAARARARLGRVTSHPHAICVEARDGVLELTGQVLASELGDILSAMSHVDGVKAVVHELEPHLSADVPSLQGGAAPVRPAHRDLWSPTQRAATGLGGGVAITIGLAKRGVVGFGLVTGGGLLLARSVTNAPIVKLLGFGGGREVNVRKSIHVRAPVEDTYAYFRAFENFPRFMSHVREVKELKHGETHWCVDGPLGLPVRWHARLVEETPNERLSWESLAGGPIRCRGSIRFESELSGGTLVELQLFYRPPFGLFGELVSRLLRADPKREVDDDLLRLKSLLEHGKASGRAGAVTLDELPLPPTGPTTMH